MAKHRRRAVKKTAIAGVAVASAVSLGAVASPGMPGAMDQAVTMQQVRELKTQIDLMATSNLVNIVGAPSWLTGMLGGAGEGSVFMAGDTSASDIYNLLNTTDPNPIKGIGVNGGVSTDPTWVQWVSGVGAPKPVPYLEGQHQELTDEYKAVYDPAYNGVVGTALDEAKAEAWQNAYNASYDPVYNALTSGTAYQSVYNVALTGYKADYLNDLYKPQYAMGMPKYNDAYNPAYDSTYKTSSKYCFGNSTCLRLAREAAEAAGDLAVAGALANAIANPSAADDAAADAYAGPKAKADADATIADAVVNADKVAKLAGDAAAALVTPDDAMDAAGKAAGEAAVAEANANLPADQQIQQWKWVDDWGIKYVVDYKTSGAWVTPAMFDELPNAAKIAYAAAVISNGDLSALAPFINWTVYLQNTNLVGWDDGNIAIGEGYRQYIEAVKDGTITAGEAQTGPRSIDIGDLVITSQDGTLDLGTDLGDIWDKIQAAVTTGEGIGYPDSGDIPTGNPEGTVKGGVIDFTLITMVMLRNPGRPNGGLYSRFAPVYQEITGINPVTPAAESLNLPNGATVADFSKLADGNWQAILNDSSGKKMVLTLKADATWEYDIKSDAPVNANPLAWANSAVASMFVLTAANELLGASQGNGSVSAVFYQVPKGEYDEGSFYATVTQEGLPLLAPIRLPANLIGAVTGESINTPFADAMEPLLKILINTSYTDVVTPEDLAEGGKYYGSDYNAYDRTLREMHLPTLFGTNTLNQREIAQLQGDLIKAVGAGFGGELTDVLRQSASRLLEALNIAPSADIDNVLKAPGDAITFVGNQIGGAISDVLVGLNDQLPDELQLIKTDDASRAEQQTFLKSIYKPLGQGLKPVADGAAVLNEGFTQLDSVITGGQLTKLQKDPIGSLITAGADLQQGGAKLQKSLTKAQKDADDLVKAVTSGDPSKIGKTVKEKADYRIDRARRDLDNGVAKVKEAAGKVKEAVKKVTDKVTKKSE